MLLFYFVFKITLYKRNYNLHFVDEETNLEG